MKETQALELSESDILLKLNDIILSFDPNFNTEGITLESKLTTELGINSIGMLYMAISIEEVFCISLENTKFSDFVTVGDIVSYIKKHL